MANDIIITPSSASVQFSASAASSIVLKVEASGSLNFFGKSGSLFAIEDSLSGSLMSVSDVSGIPILEVFSDNGVHLGKFNAEAIDIKAGGIDLSLGSGSVMFISASRRVGIGTNTPTNSLDVVGNISCSVVTASIFFGTASYLSGSNPTSSYALTSSWAINAINGGTQLVTASTYPITASWARSASAALSTYSASWATVAGLTAFAESSDFALDSNYALSASYAQTCSILLLLTESFYILSESYASSSTFASSAESASWASSSLSSSWAETASFAVNAAGGGLDILAIQVFM